MRALLVAAMLLLVILPPGAYAATPTQDIISVGPLADVWIGNDLSCQVRHTGDTAYELYPPTTTPGDCGTLVAVGSTLYAPSFTAHGTTATGSLGATTAYTLVSQSGISGFGTPSAPYTVNTVVTLPGTSLRINETDKYVVGDEQYHTDVRIDNTGASNVSLILYRAADCFLGGSDSGYGSYDSTSGIVACTQNPGNSPAGRVEEWIPRSPGSHAYQHTYDEVWRYIGTKAEFPNTCQCASVLDNGAGLSWNITIPAGGNATRSHDLRFEAPPAIPLVTSACRADGILVQVHDPAGGLTEIPLGESVATMRPSATAAPGVPTSIAPPAGAQHAEAQLAGVSHTNPSPFVQVSASAVFSRCDALAAALSGSAGNVSEAYGRGGVEDLEVRTCASCAPIVDIEALDFELLADGRGSGTRALYACDQDDVHAVQEITAECHGTTFASVRDPTGPLAPIANPFVPSADPFGTIARLVDVRQGETWGPTLGPNGMWTYGGAVLHLVLAASTAQIDVYVGYVQVSVQGAGPATPASYQANGPCTLSPDLPCE